jgi:hypothetical protein
MGLVAILVAVLLVSLLPARIECFQQDPGSPSTQAPAAPAENPQSPAPDQEQPNVADQKQSDSKTTEESLPAKKAEKPGPQKSPGTRSGKSIHKRRSRAHKPVTPDGEPRKIVIHRGGASEPIAQILPGMTEEEASHQREAAEQLMASTESNLTQLTGRTLNPNQQEMVVQIRHYVDGARSALKESDTQRAHTLALKAYLLSDDMAKH